MNDLSIKSIFVMAYITAANLITLLIVVEMINTGFSLINVGVLLSTAPGGLFFMFLMLLKPFARTSRNLPVLTTLTIMGVLAVGFSTLSEQVIDPQKVVFASIGFCGWLLYLYWYSKFDRLENVELAVGSMLPDFQLENENAVLVSSSEFRGSPALLIFYRGNWCPLCMAQIKEIANQYKELDQRGVKIILISPQSHKNTDQLAQKFDVPFKFLVDKKNKVATQLGILAKNGVPFGMQVMGYESDTVMPTVIITDKDGRIIFADLTDNYRVRPEPETFLKILDQAQPV